MNRGRLEVTHPSLFGLQIEHPCDSVWRIPDQVHSLRDVSQHSLKEIVVINSSRECWNNYMWVGVVFKELIFT